MHAWSCINIRNVHGLTTSGYDDDCQVKKLGDIPDLRVRRGYQCCGRMGYRRIGGRAWDSGGVELVTRELRRGVEWVDVGRSGVGIGIDQVAVSAQHTGSRRDNTKGSFMRKPASALTASAP